jgi:hypothetical protein
MLHVIIHRKIRYLKYKFSGGSSGGRCRTHIGTHPRQAAAGNGRRSEARINFRWQDFLKESR